MVWKVDNSIYIICSMVHLTISALLYIRMLSSFLFPGPLNGDQKRIKCFEPESLLIEIKTKLNKTWVWICKRNVTPKGCDFFLSVWGQSKLNYNCSQSLCQCNFVKLVWMLIFEYQMFFHKSFSTIELGLEGQAEWICSVGQGLIERNSQRTFR